MNNKEVRKILDMLDNGNKRINSDDLLEILGGASRYNQTSTRSKKNKSVASKYDKVDKFYERMDKN